jgi:hypothetical protein
VGEAKGKGTRQFRSRSSVASGQQLLPAWSSGAIRSAQQRAARKRFGGTSECNAAWWRTSGTRESFTPAIVVLTNKTALAAPQWGSRMGSFRQGSVARRIGIIAIALYALLLQSFLAASAPAAAHDFPGGISCAGRGESGNAWRRSCPSSRSLLHSRLRRRRLRLCRVGFDACGFLAARCFGAATRALRPFAAQILFYRARSSDQPLIAPPLPGFPGSLKRSHRHLA